MPCAPAPTRPLPSAAPEVPDADFGDVELYYYSTPGGALRGGTPARCVPNRRRSCGVSTTLNGSILRAAAAGARRAWARASGCEAPDDGIEDIHDDGRAGARGAVAASVAACACAALRYPSCACAAAVCGWGAGGGGGAPAAPEHMVLE